jgi:hypothetical protein
METIERWGLAMGLYDYDLGWFGAFVWPVLFVLFLIPWWKIWQRTGHSGAWGLLMLVPLVNLISLWVLAFKEWPALRGGRG